ncbi:WASH complex, subunit strumpellin [Baffinella frigidus]|nr:WASH complex, subunit strumpellin [Cryptophyta sp. CCMP2293]
MRELLLQTDPSRLLYLEAHAGWFDRAGKDLVGIRTLSLLHQAIGTAGLRGIDQTLSFLILSQLRSLLRFYRRQVGEGLKMLFPDLQAELNPSSTLPNNAALLYQGAFQRTAPLWPSNAALLYQGAFQRTAPLWPSNAALLYQGAFQRTAPLWPSVATAVSRIGQAQLLRRQLASELNFKSWNQRQMASELNFSAKLDSPTLAQVHPYPSDEKKLLPTLAPYLDSMGLSCPMLKIYLTTEPMDGIALFLMLFAVAQLTNYTLDPALNLLVPKEKNGLDSAAITVGILTVLKQFHSSHTQKFVAYLLQYVRCQANPTP